MNKNYYHFSICVFCIVQVLLVWPFIDNSFWLDEIFTLVNTKGTFLDALKQLSQATNHFPLYFIIIKIWYMLFGETEIVGRLFSLIFALMSIPLSMSIAKRLFNSYSLAILVGAIVTLSPFHTYITLEARPYSFLAGLFLISLHYYLKLSEQENKATRIKFFITLLLMSYTHVYGIFTVISYGVVAVLQYLSVNKKIGLKNLKTYLLVGMCFLPYLPIFLTQAQKKDYISWIEPTTLSFIHNKIFVESFLIHNQGTFVLYALVMFFFLYRRIKTTVAKSHLFTLLITPLILALFAYWTYIPVLHIRYTYQIYYLFVFMFAGTILFLTKRIQKVFLPLIVLLTLLVSVFYPTFFESFEARIFYADWKGFSEYLDDEYVEGDNVVHAAPFWHDAYRVYSKKKIKYRMANHFFDILEKDKSKLPNRVWVPIFPAYSALKIEDFHKKLSSQYRLEKSFEFKRATLYKFVKKSQEVNYYDFVKENFKVLKVTNLNDSGKGSLRWAIKQKGSRVIIFETSGIIKLKSELRIKEPRLIIAGHTAPSPGVGIINAGISIEASHTLLQHLRIRVGEAKTKEKPEDKDAIKIRSTRNVETLENILIDHVTASWAIDEVFSVSGKNIQQMRNIIIQNSIIAEGLNKSIHPKGAHSMGALLIHEAKDVSFKYNLFANNVTRVPRLKGGSAARVFNNVIFNSWDSLVTVSYYNEAKDVKTFLEVSSNYVVRPHHWEDNILDDQKNFIKRMFIGKSPYVFDITNSSSKKGMKNDIIVLGYDDNWLHKSYGLESLELVIFKPATKTQMKDLAVYPDPKKEYSEILNNVGARPADRDQFDLQLIKNIKNMKGRFLDRSELNIYKLKVVKERSQKIENKDLFLFNLHLKHLSLLNP
jgi:hypothetical protein